MKFGIFAVLLLCSAAMCADAPPASPPPAPDAAVDSVLDALDKRGKTLKEFTADVEMKTTYTADGATNTRTGRILFQKKGDAGDARMHVILDYQVKKNGKNLIRVENKLEYLLDDGWLYDRDYPKKLEVKRQITNPGEKVNLLKLGEGPFPLPIGQSKQDVHRNFAVTKIAPAQDDPPGTTHLELKPLEGTSMARHFSKVDIWVDPKNDMPVRIHTLDATESEQRQTNFTNVKVNPVGGLKDADLQLPQVDQKGWSRHNEALKR